MNVSAYVQDVWICQPALASAFTKKHRVKKSPGRHMINLCNLSGKEASGPEDISADEERGGKRLLDGSVKRPGQTLVATDVGQNRLSLSRQRIVYEASPVPDYVFT